MGDAASAVYKPKIFGFAVLENLAFPFAVPARSSISTLPHAFKLDRSLLAFSLAKYEVEVADLGNTEGELLVKERVGQSYFRHALLDYFGSRCPLTGIRNEAFLRASHIVPWAEYRSDEERLDVFNGILLAVHWDAAFDRGLVSFDGDGRVLTKQGLSAEPMSLLALKIAMSITYDDAQRRQLMWHRKHFGFQK
jgi:predicted restriction endonuclease